MFKRTKHVGVDSFFEERNKLLDAYDVAKRQAADDAVKTEHGVTAEADVRRWLGSFLPKRYGVCKGYIITTNRQYEGHLEEWDVIIYDAIESPILFSRGSNDQGSSDLKRAIPVEHVRAVIEVKATLNARMAEKCASKILKLNPYFGVNTSAEYPEFFAQPFVTAAIFMETKVDSLKQYQQALDNLAVPLQQNPMISFMGALVFRSQRNKDHSGYLKPMLVDDLFDFPNELELSSNFQYPDGSHGVLGTFTWCVNAYPEFLFDLLASIRGKRSQRVSSFYGMDFGNTQGSRLFFPQDDT